MDHFCWIALASAAFLPATSAPVGFTAEGLPVGIQIVGPYLGDQTTIRFAELLSTLRGGFVPPSLATH
jgi:amidase